MYKYKRTVSKEYEVVNIWKYIEEICIYSFKSTRTGLKCGNKSSSTKLKGKVKIRSVQNSKVQYR